MLFGIDLIIYTEIPAQSALEALSKVLPKQSEVERAVKDTTKAVDTELTSFTVYPEPVPEEEGV